MKMLQIEKERKEKREENFILANLASDDIPEDLTRAINTSRGEDFVWIILISKEVLRYMRGFPCDNYQELQ